MASDASSISARALRGSNLPRRPKAAMITRADAAPSVPDRARSVRASAVSSDSGPGPSVRSARSGPMKRASSSRSS